MQPRHSYRCSSFSFVRISKAAYFLKAGHFLISFTGTLLLISVPSFFFRTGGRLLSQLDIPKQPRSLIPDLLVQKLKTWLLKLLSSELLGNMMKYYEKLFDNKISKFALILIINLTKIFFSTSIWIRVIQKLYYILCLFSVFLFPHTIPLLPVKYTGTPFYSLRI